jgi:hypothetical protein
MRGYATAARKIGHEKHERTQKARARRTVSPFVNFVFFVVQIAALDATETRVAKPLIRQLR